jgi:hypothetical protein
MRIRRRRCGMALVDGLIGISLVLVSALVFSTAFPVASKGRAASEQSALALATAEQKIEAIRNMPYTSIGFDYFETPGLNYGYGYVDVYEVPDTLNLKQVRVTIHWWLGNQYKEVELTTYVTDH